MAQKYIDVSYNNCLFTIKLIQFMKVSNALERKHFIIYLNLKLI